MAHKRKIMTVVLLSAGCGTTSAPSPHSTRTADRPVPTLAAAAAQPPAPPPAPASDEDRSARLRALRSELYENDREHALASMPRFRPLCDSEGYPLVGNIATKGSFYSVQAFCGEVRTAAVAAAKAGS